MTTVLLTGFEPFDGAATNPSWEAVRLAASLWSGDAAIELALLPVEFARCDEALLSAIERTSPDLVIAVGLAGGIPDLHLERVAINLDDARIPDNAGYQPIDQPINAAGPAAYFTGLPVKRAARVLAELGIPASISQSAGTFVCNHVFYTMMASGVRGGFVHVPFSPDMTSPDMTSPDMTTPDMAVGAPSMPVETMARGLVAVIEAALILRSDDVAVGGTIF